MTPDDSDTTPLQATEEALAMALRAYVTARSEAAALDDIVDDCLGAVNETLMENWSIDPASSDAIDV